MRSIFFISWILLTSGLCAQVQEDITVVHRSIRVHVINDQGQPVRGLGPEDFEVKEAGEIFQPDIFEELDLGASLDLTQSRPERRFLFVLESYGMYPGSFKDAIKALRHWTTHQWPENALVKVVQIEDKMTHLTPFTANKAEVLAALDKAKHKSLLWKKLFFIEKETMRNVQAYEGAGLNAEAASNMVRSSLHEKARLKKDFYLTFYKNMMLLSTALKGLSGHKTAYLLTGGGYLEETGNAFHDTTALARNLNASLNDAGATVYTLLGKSPQLPHQQAMGIGAQSRALPLVGSLSANRLKSLSWWPPEDLGVPARNTVLENGKQQETGPKAVAEGTGGFFFKTASSKPYSLNLEKVYKASHHFYRLGYTRIPGKDEGRANIEVVVHNARERDWDVKYGGEASVRKAYGDMSRDEQMLDFDARLLYGDALQNDLDCHWDYALFAHPDGGWLTALFMKMRTDRKPKEGFEIGFGVNNSASEPLNASNGFWEGGDQSETVVAYDLLKTDEPPAEVRFLARNKSTGQASFQQIAVQPETGPMSRIFFASLEPSRVLPLHHMKKTEKKRQKKRKKRKKAREKQEKTLWDPFRVGDQIIQPWVGAAFERPESIPFFFFVTNPDDAAPAFSTRASLRGVTVELPAGLEEIPAKITGASKAGPGLYIFYGNLSTAGLKPGAYRLYVKLTDPEGRISRQVRELTMGE